MQKYESASTRGDIGFFEVDSLSGIKISDEDDFTFAESVLKFKMDNIR